MASSTASTLVIIATYNERENIDDICRRVLSLHPSVDMLIVDDSSPDGTAELVETLMLTHPSLHLVRRPRKSGLASALLDAFKWGMLRGYDAVVNLDADFSHNPCDIPQLVHGLESADLVIGSRYLNGIRVINWPIRRLFLSLVAGRYLRLVTRMPFADPTSGFRGFRPSALQELLSVPILSQGFSFHFECLYRVWRSGLRVVEHPIVFRDRRHGATKMNFRIIFEALWIAMALKAGHSRRFGPRHVTSPQTYVG